MKMSKETYNKFKDWYDYTVENATDEIMEYIFGCLAYASKIAMDNINKYKEEEIKEKDKAEA